MQRILIIEDNKTLANLMAKKIASELDFEIDVAYSLAEAKLFLKKYNYFVTLLDINLPDAPNGEVVDYVLKTGNHAIVLSGNIDKEFRKKVLQKNIIDYINKSGINDIHYIIQTITRLQKNQEHTILLVDDSLVFRKQMQSMLENMFYKVISVAHGEEALGILQSNPNISLVLTDYHMPVMDGLELTTHIRKTANKNEISIIAISNDTDDAITALFLKNGANDYIKKPFSKEELSCRINNSIEALENIQTITNSANRDFLTGLYNRRYFFNNAKEYFTNALDNEESFAIAMIDIDHFKTINDTYGHDAGDKVIVNLSDILRSKLGEKDIIARLGGEEFCLLLKDCTKDEARDALEKIRTYVANSCILSQSHKEIRYTISAGLILSIEATFEATLHEADALLYKAKQNGRNQIVIA